MGAPETPAVDSREWERIRWHCRRGMLEVDIVLQRFVEQWAGRLEDSELRIFKELLELSDNDLWDLIISRVEPLRADWKPLVDRLQKD
jgi:antitoxin CptB